MSDYPERINISPVHRQKREDDFYLVDRAAFPGKGVEYTRTDHVQTLISEAVAEALERAEELASIHSDWSADEIKHYRCETQKDAIAALDARNKRLSDRRARDKLVRDEALREAAGIAQQKHKSAMEWAKTYAKGFDGKTDSLRIAEEVLALIDADDKEP